MQPRQILCLVLASAPSPGQANPPLLHPSSTLHPPHCCPQPHPLPGEMRPLSPVPIPLASPGLSLLLLLALCLAQGVLETALPSPWVENCPSSLCSQEQVWAAPASTYPHLPPQLPNSPSPQPSSGSIQASLAVTNARDECQQSPCVPPGPGLILLFVAETEIFIWDVLVARVLHAFKRITQKRA